MVDFSDSTLILNTLQGDSHAFGELVRRYQVPVFNVCYRLLGEQREAEDLSQEVFMRAYQRLQSFDVQRPFGPWIRRVAVNLCYNHMQKNQPVLLPIQDEQEYAAETSRNPQSVLESSEKNRAIRQAIAKLPPEYRIALEMRHFHEMSYEEIAQELDLSLNTVRSHLFRARKKMIAFLNEE
jgi:RNA polymerase sigma-70 factor (ECF subfamily)